MTRLLLTLLALLTGLVAQTAPAQARVGGAEVTIQLPGSSKRSAIASRAPSWQPTTQVWRVRLTSFVTPEPSVQPPTVRPGIDRARE